MLAELRSSTLANERLLWRNQALKLDKSAAICDPKRRLTPSNSGTYKAICKVPISSEKFKLPRPKSRTNKFCLNLILLSIEFRQSRSIESRPLPRIFFPIPEFLNDESILIGGKSSASSSFLSFCRYEIIHFVI